jgi:glycosyltransferase involved in cell wall biosynthesis
MTEPERSRRLLALIEYSGCESSFIGFDCVPLSSAETTAEGMGGGFALMLAAAARGDRIAAISETSALEFSAWRSMIAGAGLAGPEIAAITLPQDAPTPGADDIATAQRLLSVGTLPLVLVVGSHEPRKNHLAVLHAAELVWRDNIAFNLVFVGGNAWHAERFVDRVRELQGAGRPVLTLPALADGTLWAAYKLARCTLCPSFNEGFGLPVAESLASGTPVITSKFGSMREIAGDGGGVLIDPRNDHEIANALRQLLTDDDFHTAKSREASALVGRSWEEYATEAWDYLVHGNLPDRT